MIPIRNSCYTVRRTYPVALVEECINQKNSITLLTGIEVGSSEPSTILLGRVKR